MIGLFQFCCGFSFLAGLVTDDAELKGRKFPFGSGRDSGGEHRKRCRIKGALVLCLLSLMPTGVSRAAEPEFDINIPAMNAAEALNRLAEQTGSVMLFSYDLARARNANAVSGRYTLLEGLELLLRDTGLSGGLSNKRVVTIAEEGSMKAENGKKRGWIAGLVAALGATAAIDAGADQATEAESRPTPLSEIVVTAQKREERMHDVPIPVTALNAESLVSNNQLRLQDFFSTIPGLSVTPGFSVQVLSIRGITTGLANPTVGVLVDDVPYGASTQVGTGNVIPDIDPGDLERIEVLRGPQGTLYGASSMGGLFKFVTVDPSTDAIDGRVQASLSSVSNGDESGYSLRGSINLPLGKTAAIRASAFGRRDPGYIENIQSGQDGVNRATAMGGRLSGIWEPSDTFSIKLSALFQEIEAEGTSDAFIDLPDMQQSYFEFDGIGDLERESQAYSATLNATLGSVALTAVSGYNVNSLLDSFDTTWAFGALPEIFFGVSGTPFINDSEVKKFTQEIRLTFPLGGNIEWLAGAFYTDENSNWVQRELAADTETGAIVAEAYNFNFPTTFEEYAVFTNLTFQFTERFDLQVGGRHSWIDQTYQSAATGAYVPIFNLGASSPFVTPEVSSNATAFTYLITPRFRVSPEVMMYARLASGYRAGGPNPIPGGVVPPEYQPDETQNYEIGVKGDFFEGKLLLDASIFYIDWKDLQLQLLNPVTFIAYIDNGSRAESQGVELSVEASPLAGLTISAWGAWTDAVLTEDFPAGSAAIGLSDDRLPNTSRFSGNLTVQQGFPLGDRANGFVEGVVSYVGDRESSFVTTPERQRFPSYTKVDLRGGVAYGSWEINLFANNLTDERGVLGGGIGAFPPFALTYIQPRTIGLSVSKTF